MLKRSSIVTTFIIILIFTFTTSSYTDSYRRNITAWFNNIQVEIDGEKLEMADEPIVFEDKVYMPIEELADALYINFVYDEDEAMVRINTNRLFDVDTDTSSVPLTFQKHYELESLRKQVAEMEEEINRLQDGRLPYARIRTLEEMEEYIKEHFKVLKDINMSIQLLDLGRNEYSLNASFGNEISKWKELDRREVEGWIDDIYYAIRHFYDPEAKLEGIIRASSLKSGSQYTSYYTRGNMLYFDFMLSEHKKSPLIDGVKIENALNKKLKNYNNEVFTYEVFVNNNDVDLLVYYEKKKFDNWSPTSKMQYLKRIRTEVDRIYEDVNIDGKIIYSKNDEATLRFSISDDFISSYDLVVEMEEYINKTYDEFKYSGDTFKFNYKIYESYSNAFEVVLDGDFEIDDSDWEDVMDHGESSFRSHVQKVFRYLEGIYDVDIFGEVRDASLRSICDVEYYSTGSGSYRYVHPIIFP
ncbi:hypothetical protein F8154_14795 [Alkaliphilus pronyensis]|uniref:Copper amine oxidase N-terminal domain-containing protein n=1 Tax=Alkaliphilus pronyensis TaxID=1482732 RepID=A0A6I0EVD3_9FIRM|nr:hypothetical protein [Alkaliphilus pronyensis]KAB3529388.1 hypothetical protein F8154_14795 [Alkaliphilus pronyensis]